MQVVRAMSPSTAAAAAEDEDDSDTTKPYDDFVEYLHDLKVRKNRNVCFCHLILVQSFVKMRLSSTVEQDAREREQRFALEERAQQVCDEFEVHHSTVVTGMALLLLLCCYWVSYSSAATC